MINRQRKNKDLFVSLVLPVFNEMHILPRLTAAIETALARLRFEIIYVNDGSHDGSAQLLDELATEKPYVKVIHFSRNFGQTSAVLAGINFGSGDVFVVMDSDMQDNPCAILQFLEKWHEGFDIVYAIRTKRKENFIKVFLFAAFYRLLAWLSPVYIPFDAGNFGLIDRQVALLITQFQEYDRFYPGLRSWVGFRQVGINIERADRYDRRPRVSLWSLVLLAKTAIFSFSTIPLLIFYWLSALSFLVLCCFSVFAIYNKFVTGLSIPGWTSTIMIACLFGSLNSLGIAILGEYIIRIYNQVRARPAFIIDRMVNMSQSTSTISEDSIERFSYNSPIPAATKK
jgi:glycosyltransferase involved in cell wall biosynthesis